MSDGTAKSSPFFWFSARNLMTVIFPVNFLKETSRA
jgi:hypothetical protein